MPTTINENYNFTVASEDDSLRIDGFLSQKLPNITRARVQKLIKESLVLVNGKSVKPSHKVREEEQITVDIPTPPSSTVEAEDIPLNILFEDESVIVINKQHGLTVHPGAGNLTGTLVSALLHHTKELSPFGLSTIGGPLRPGIVHRLDKDTSGVMILAKTDKAHISLSEQFKEHSTKRIYNAICFGVPKEKSGTIDASLGRDPNDRKKISTNARHSRRAVTKYKVLEELGFFSFIEARPETGRTHQIRVHLKSINHPIVGDPVYCKRTVPVKTDKQVADCIKQIKRQLLHAEYFGFTHPETNKFMEFTAPLPDDMNALLTLLRDKVR